MFVQACKQTISPSWLFLLSSNRFYSPSCGPGERFGAAIMTVKGKKKMEEPKRTNRSLQQEACVPITSLTVSPQQVTYICYLTGILEDTGCLKPSPFCPPCLMAV